MSTHFTSALLVLTGIAQLVPAQTVTTIVNNGPSTNRVDLVVLGDGYTTEDLPKYATDVQQFVLNMFQQQPYSEYKPYFNVHRIDLISANAGADHPETNTHKTTALDAAFNCGGIQRLICVDTTKVLNIVNSVMLPSQRDIILVLVNDSTYGGSGGTLAVSSTNALGVEIVLHELGHSLGLLTDEYGGPPPPVCDSSVEPTEANATSATTRATIKWNPWIDVSTAIPTRSTSPGVPGLYEGVKYCDTGLYRPTYNSKMRSLGEPFEQVNTEQLVKRYYNWVSPIESSSPAATMVTVTKGQVRSFSIETLLPATHTLDRAWFLDGQPKASGASYLVDSSLLSLGDHSVVAIAHDPTDMVRSDADEILTERVGWALRVLPSLVDSTAPVITLGISGTSGMNGWYRSNVTVNWNVTDPESGIASSNGCSPTTLTNNTPGTTLTCSATNGAGLPASVSVTIKIDKTAPVISGMQLIDCTLWPPNHKLVQVAAVGGSDALSSLAAFGVTGASNEPENGRGDGDTAPDIVITGSGMGPRTVQLRAERAGTGTARIYTLTATASDQAGNSVTARAICTVPQSQVH